MRDLAKLDGTSGATAVVDRVIYSAFGGVTSESNPSEGCLFKYTGRPTDNATGIENHLNRVKLAGSADWMSEDPKGLAAGQTNTRDYCGNSPTNATDPSGLMEVGLTNQMRANILQDAQNTLASDTSLTAGERAMRLDVVQAALYSKGLFGGGHRNGQYWTKTSSGAYSLKNAQDLFAALDDLWTPKPKSDQLTTGCWQMAELIYLRAAAQYCRSQDGRTGTLPWKTADRGGGDQPASEFV